MRPIRLNVLTILYIFLICLGCLWVVSKFGPDCMLGHSKELTVRDKLILQQKELRDFELKLNEYKKIAKHRVNVYSEKTLHKEQSIPWIYAITPTYFRPQQKADLTRLSQTLLHLPNFHWIVVEDSPVKTDLVTNLLRRTGLNYTHLVVTTPDNLKLKPGDPRWSKFRGVLQRNVALQWLRSLPLNNVIIPSVVYFMDDDNTYDLELFHEMRKTLHVSVWPVGLVSKLRYEGPICNNGKVTGWVTYWKPNRPFAVDMAGFAINTQVLLKFYQAEFNKESDIGFMETDFLQLLTTRDEVEPLFNCTRVLVWHTQTVTPDLSDETKMLRKFGHGSDPSVEV